MKYKNVVCVVALIWSAVAWLPNRAHGGLIYEFADVVGVPTQNFSVNLAESIDIRIYIRETNGTNFLSEELFGASVLLDYSGSPQVVGILSTADITPNAGFTDLTPPPTATVNQAGFTGSVGLDPFLSPELGPRLLLGTFSLRGLAAGSTTLVATDRDLLSADTITGLGTELDALIASGTASITVNVSAVPEPSTAISVSLLSIALLISRTLRRAGPR